MMTPNGGVFGRNPTFNNVTVENNLTLTNGNFIIGTSGKGIDFSATSDGTGTMTSELLSDYEEGTWTPDLQFGGANTAITYESRNGTYTKIGRQVTARGYIKLTSNGTATGDAAIAALPFTSNSASNHHNTGPIAASNVTTATQVVSILLANGTSILLNEFVSGGVVAALNDTDISDTAIMTFQITYFT